MANDDIKVPGTLRRNAPLLLGILVVILIGPSISRGLESYRGVVLEQRDGKTLVGLEEKAPVWIDGIDAQVGQIVAKTALSWNPQAVPAEAGDHQLVRLHERYSSTYSGRVINIAPPRAPGGAHVALIEKSDGSRINLPLHGQHLAPLQVGDYVQKEAFAWEPVIVPPPEGAKAPEGAAPPPTPGAP